MDYRIVVVILIIAIIFYLIGKIVKKIIKIPILIIIGLISIIITYPLIENINGYIQNNRWEKMNIANKKIVFLGDSITAGENANGTFSNDYGKNIGYVQKIVDANSANNLNNEINNYAVSGFTSQNLLNQLEGNLNFTNSYQLNLDFMKNKNIIDQENSIFKNESDSLITKVSQADAIVLTIGNNDLLSEIQDPISKEVKFSFLNIKDKINMVNENRIKVIQKIQKINQDVKIIMIGAYVPYANLNFLINQVYYDLVGYYDFDFDLKLRQNNIINVNNLIIRDNVSADINNNITNLNNIHLSNKGYEYLFNEVVKKLNKV